MPPRVYFDLCALKRGWDDPGQLRVKLEADAVGSLLEMARAGGLIFVRSAVHESENQRNPDVNRRGAVEELLQWHALEPLDLDRFTALVSVLEPAGIRGFDAAHLAAAEVLKADVLVTTDDRFRTRAARAMVAVRVLGPIEFAAEVTQ